MSYSYHELPLNVFLSLFRGKNIESGSLEKSKMLRKLKLWYNSSLTPYERVLLRTGNEFPNLEDILLNHLQCNEDKVLCYNLLEEIEVNRSDFVPFKNSIKWKLQREFYATMGLNAWNSIVPSQISTNSHVAKYYLEIIDSHFAQQNMNEECPYVAVIELAAGHGKLSFSLARELYRRKYKATVFATDFQTSSFDLIMTNQKDGFTPVPLLQLVEHGLLRFNSLEVSDNDELMLAQSQSIASEFHRIHKASPSLVVIVANYAFDSFASDLLLTTVDGQVMRVGHPSNSRSAMETYVATSFVNDHNTSSDWERYLSQSLSTQPGLHVVPADGQKVLQAIQTAFTDDTHDGSRPDFTLVTGDCPMQHDDKRWGPFIQSRVQESEDGKDNIGGINLSEFDPPFISPSPQCLAVPINFNAIALTFNYVFGRTCEINHYVKAQIQSSFAVSVCSTNSNSVNSDPDSDSDGKMRAPNDVCTLTEFLTSLPKCRTSSDATCVLPDVHVDDCLLWELIGDGVSTFSELRWAVLRYSSTSMLEKLVSLLSIAPTHSNRHLNHHTTQTTHTLKYRLDLHNWWADDSTVLLGDFQEIRRSIADFLLAVHSSRRVSSELVQKALITVLSLFRPYSFLSGSGSGSVSGSDSSVRKKRKISFLTDADLDWCLDYWCPLTIVDGCNIQMQTNTKIITTCNLSDVPVIVSLLDVLGRRNEATSVSQQAVEMLQVMVTARVDKRLRSSIMFGIKERRTTTYYLLRRLQRLHRRYTLQNDESPAGVVQPSVHALAGRGVSSLPSLKDLSENTSTQAYTLELKKEVSQQRLKRKLLERQTHKLELGI